MIRKNKPFELVGYFDNGQVFINNSTGIASINVTIRSFPPDSIDGWRDKEELRVYVGSIDGLDDNKNELQYIRINNIKEYLKNKILIMQPMVKENKKELLFCKGINVHAIPMHDNFNSENFYASVHVFSNKNISNVKTIDEFEELLRERKTLCDIQNPWPSGEEDYPDAIIWHDDNNVYLYNDIEKQQYRDSLISFKMHSYNRKKLDITWLNRQYRYQDIAYIPIDDLDKIMEGSIEPSYYSSNNINIEKSNNMTDNNSSLATSNKEADVIFKRFYDAITKKYHLTYNSKDIINFHNSMKSNIFTVLTGLSGTGKSKIVTAYADALGIKDGDFNQFNMISVRPFWQDDADLIGFVDNINNNYHPGDSGIVDTIISANDHPDKIFIVVFDEMNLARVEYYFSQFLSVLEKDADDRILNLYNSKIQPRLYNGDKYPANIKIPNNIRFVGTMNIDETTFQVSDKVLDRANVIRLKSVSFSNRIKYQNLDDTFDNIECSYDSFNQSIHNDNYSFSERELAFFDNLNECIQKCLPNLGIGWRTLNNIERFISNVDFYKNDNFDVKDALDYQVAQRILPKIRGTKIMIDSLLDENNKDGFIKVLDAYKDLSDFKFTRQLLQQKLNEARVIGFAN